MAINRAQLMEPVTIVAYEDLRRRIRVEEIDAQTGDVVGWKDFSNSLSFWGTVQGQLSELTGEYFTLTVGLHHDQVTYPKAEGWLLYVGTRADTGALQEAGQRSGALDLWHQDENGNKIRVALARWSLSLSASEMV